MIHFLTFSGIDFFNPGFDRAWSLVHGLSTIYRGSQNTAEMTFSASCLSILHTIFRQFQRDQLSWYFPQEMEWVARSEPEIGLYWSWFSSHSHFPPLSLFCHLTFRGLIVIPCWQIRLRTLSISGAKEEDVGKAGFLRSSFLHQLSVLLPENRWSSKITYLRRVPPPSIIWWRHFQFQFDWKFWEGPLTAYFFLYPAARHGLSLARSLALILLGTVVAIILYRTHDLVRSTWQ